MEADSPHGRAPVPWQPASASGSEDRTPPTGGEHRLGFSATDLADLIRVPDDLADLVALLEGSEAAFNGAYVPLVVHEPTEAERSYDTAEWAADLIRTAGGRLLVLAPHAAEESMPTGPLSARQWNHTVAMIERLEAVCRRFAIDLAVGETIDGRPLRDGGGLDPGRPILHLLDAGQLMSEGCRPVRLLSPEPACGPTGLVDRLRGLLRERG